jgi:hypothetical protein
VAGRRRPHVGARLLLGGDAAPAHLVEGPVQSLDRAMDGVALNQTHLPRSSTTVCVCGVWCVVCRVSCVSCVSCVLRWWPPGREKGGGRVRTLCLRAHCEVKANSQARVS